MNEGFALMLILAAVDMLTAALVSGVVLFVVLVGGTDTARRVAPVRHGNEQEVIEVLSHGIAPTSIEGKSTTVTIQVAAQTHLLGSTELNRVYVISSVSRYNVSFGLGNIILPMTVAEELPFRSSYGVDTYFLPTGQKELTVSGMSGQTLFTIYSSTGQLYQILARCVKATQAMSINMSPFALRGICDVTLARPFRPLLFARGTHAIVIYGPSISNEVLKGKEWRQIRELEPVRGKNSVELEALVDKASISSAVDIIGIF